jgi:hypothetical protein
MDNVKNAADEDAVKKMASDEKKHARNELEDFRYLLKLPQFKRVIWNLLEYCAPFESPLHTNAIMMANNIGRGDVGRNLIAKISDADPAALFKLKEEAKNV